MNIAFNLLVLMLLLLPCVPLLAEGYLAKGVRVIDGDTLKVETLMLPWDVALTNQRIRIADFDAWESSYRRRSVNVTAEEVKKGKQATEDLKELVAEAQVFILPYKKRSRDVYGRILATIEIKKDNQTIQLKDWMRERGHLRDG